MKIYAPSHTLTADIDLQQGAVVHHELGGEHYVRLPFTLPTAVTFPIGSYVNVKGFGRFEVTEENQPKFNAQTGGYDYDLQLDASYMKWKNKLLRYRPLNAKGSETSFRLTATIGTHLNVVTDNLRRLGEADPSFLYDGKEAYVSALKGMEDDAKNRHAFIAYEGTDILSALNQIAEAFGCEWWVEDNVICMGRCELATDPVTLEMHDAIEQMSTQGSKGTYANRLIVFGSERNLPANYREATSPDIVTDGVVQRRLMLPEKDAPKGYIQAPATTEKNAVEAVVVMEDIYPKVECTVKTLTPYVSETEDKEGNKVSETFYRVTDTAFKFTKEMILPDKKLHIVFQSGRMNGMDFEAEYSQKNNWFEIVANDTYGRKLPDKDLHPAQDDEFILYNWDSSKAADTGIIEKAEAKLLEAARKQLDKMQKDGTNYECTLSSYWAEKTFRTSAGEYTHYAVGQPVTLKDEARFPQGRKSRIIGYEIKLDIPYDTPRYIVGESPFQSRTERLQQQIDSLTVGGKTYQGTGGSSSGGGQYIYIITQTSQVAPSDTNVFSAARTELDFVHKKKADTIEAGHTFAARQQFQQGADFGSSVTVSGDLLTRGKSTLSGGADFGSTFVEGIAGGRGGRIDANGHAELDSLTLRRFLEVPELRYNRVTVMAGVQWRGAGGGIVKEVTHGDGRTPQRLAGENDFDLAKNVQTGGHTHRLWPFTAAPGTRLEGSFDFTIRLTRGTANTGCFAAFRSVTLRGRDRRQLHMEFIRRTTDPREVEVRLTGEHAPGVKASLAATSHPLMPTQGQYTQGLIAVNHNLNTGDAQTLTFHIEGLQPLDLNAVVCDIYALTSGGWEHPHNDGKARRVTLECLAPMSAAFGRIKLKLERGEVGMVQPDDICMGIFHNLTDDQKNEQRDSDSGTGRIALRGFSTVYFRVVDILERGDNSVFTYALRPADKDWSPETYRSVGCHPSVGMHFAVYGNFSNDLQHRQQSRYSTLTYERFLKGVSSWEFDEDHTMAQFGDLSNLRIGGREMAGYSAYINNLYMSGVIDQFERRDPTMEADSSLGDYIREGETTTLRARIRNGYGENVSAKASGWVILRDTGQAGPDSRWNQAHALRFDETEAAACINLTHADLGGKTDAAFTLSAVYAGRTLTQTLTLRAAAKDGKPGKDGADGKDGAPGQDGALGHGVAFSWSKDDHYTEAQLNEFLAVGHQESWSASVAGVKIPAEARVGDFVFASFRAKDLKNVHTYYARLTVIMPNRVDFAAVSLAHSVIPKGETGAQGVEGAIYRKTEWSAGMAYNDGSKVEDDGHRYVDLVTVREELQEGVTQYHFVCTGCHTSTASNRPTPGKPSAKWQEANNQRPIYTPLLLAEGAVIDFLQGNTIKVTERVDGVDKVVATLGNGTHPIYVGEAKNGEPANAPFSVRADGRMTSTSGNIGGWDITPSAIASANGSSVLDAVTGNIACSGTLISRPVQITDENFRQYTAGLARYLDLFRTGRVIILTTCHSTPDGGNHAGQMIGSWLNIHFPSAECKKNDQSGQIPTEALNALQYLGNTFYLFNLAEHWVEIPLGGREREPCSILLTGRFRQKRKNGATSSTVTTSLTVSRLSSVRLTCVNDGLSTVWEYEADEADSLASTSWNPNIPVIIPGSPSDPDRFDPNATIRPEITPRP